MFVNETKPYRNHGMICQFSERDDPLGEAATKGMGKKPVSIWHSSSCQGQRKNAVVTKAQVIKAWTRVLSTSW